MKNAFLMKTGSASLAWPDLFSFVIGAFFLRPNYKKKKGLATRDYFSAAYVISVIVCITQPSMRRAGLQIKWNRYNGKCNWLNHIACLLVSRGQTVAHRVGV